MILADSSIWVDFLRQGDSLFEHFLDRIEIMAHPHVIGEVMLGSLKHPAQVQKLMRKMPQAAVASHDEVMALIEAARLAGRGVGYTDVHLLASARLGDQVSLWTRDKRLAAVAAELGLDFKPH